MIFRFKMFHFLHKMFRHLRRGGASPSDTRILGAVQTWKNGGRQAPAIIISPLAEGVKGFHPSVGQKLMTGGGGVDAVTRPVGGGSLLAGIVKELLHGNEGSV